MSSYLWRLTIDYESFTVGLTPFIINDPRLIDWHIEKITDQWVTFGAWWQGKTARITIPTLLQLSE